ncbi:MAG: hypothetical protein ACRD0X_01340 [Thermoanaerobaculia bacterium]
MLLAILLASASAPGEALAQEPVGVELPSPGPPLDVAAPQLGAMTLNQPLHPNPSFCNAASEGINQSIADNFLVLSLPFDISQIVVWGIFFLDNTPGTDEYAILFHSDSGGLPGAVVEQQSGVPASRVDTGLNFADKDIYQFTMDLASPIQLAPGTYWIELFNDASSQSDDFCWIQGLEDGTNGIPGHVFASQTPGVTWIPQGGEMAILLGGTVVPVELQGFDVE